MPKWIKYTLGAMIILFVAGMNLSSMCHPPAEALEQGEYIEARMSLPSIDAVMAEVPSSHPLLEEDGNLKELSWATLADVDFKDVYVEELDAYYWKPSFGASVKAVEGKEVYITGYIIPVDYDEDFYVLSRYQFANCFFCGGAGPESVVDLRFPAKTRAYKTDERLTFKGTLALNADDIYQMNYILEGAVEYTP
jgi:hypothetical protein